MLRTSAGKSVDGFGCFLFLEKFWRSRSRDECSGGGCSRARESAGMSVDENVRVLL